MQRTCSRHERPHAMQKMLSNAKNTHTQDWITNKAKRAKSPRPPVFCKNVFTTFIISVDNVHGAYEFVINQSATLQSVTIIGIEYCTHCTERLRNKWLIRAQLNIFWQQHKCELICNLFVIKYIFRHAF